MAVYGTFHGPGQPARHRAAQDGLDASFNEQATIPRIDIELALAGFPQNRRKTRFPAFRAG
jgi:hypothetical protein